MSGLVVVAGMLAASAAPPVTLEAQRQAADPRFSQWAAIREPVAGEAASVGFYSAGCLAGAQELPLDGDGFVRMRPSRNRGYGHPSLIAYLAKLAADRHAASRRVLLIGDLGLARGGPLLTGHASHQNGLDADVWFTTLAVKPTARQRERLGASSYVVGRRTLRPNWGAAQRDLLAAAAGSSSVERIFVSPPIKRDMCRQYPGAPWLHRLRAWWGHEDHFHVRLVCPPGSAECRPQDPLDAGDPGCGAELDWWFSSEADDEWRKLRAATEPRRFPDLPLQCSNVAR
jgi:penicillin-insensitive murein endopeptidase